MPVAVVSGEIRIINPYFPQHDELLNLRQCQLDHRKVPSWSSTLSRLRTTDIAAVAKRHSSS